MRRRQSDSWTEKTRARNMEIRKAIDRLFEKGTSFLVIFDRSPSDYYGLIGLRERNVEDVVPILDCIIGENLLRVVKSALSECPVTGFTITAVHCGWKGGLGLLPRYYDCRPDLLNCPPKASRPKDMTFDDYKRMKLALKRASDAYYVYLKNKRRVLYVDPLEHVPEGKMEERSLGEFIRDQGKEFLSLMSLGSELHNGPSPRHMFIRQEAAAAVASFPCCVAISKEEATTYSQCKRPCAKDSRHAGEIKGKDLISSFDS